jgi:hypothetical protein
MNRGRFFHKGDRFSAYLLLKGIYEKEWVTINALFDESEKLPDYHTKKVTVTPYSKEELVEEMTVEKGNMLFIFIIQNPMRRDYIST